MADFIIIIRSEPDASCDVAMLKRYKVPAIAIPVMKAESLSFRLPDMVSFQAVVFTSRHAVAAIADSPSIRSLRSLPTYAVGRSTAYAARKAGFDNIIVGHGSGSGLVSMMTTDLCPHAGTLLWPSATIIGFDISASLAKFGFVVQQMPVYAMPARAHASTYLSDRLVTNSSAAVVAMSARSIDLFSKMLILEKLDDHRQIITVIAGSQSIASAAGSGWADILVAKAPRRTRLLTIATFMHRRRASVVRNS